MKTSQLLLITLSIFICCTSFRTATVDNWEEAYNKKGTQVYTRATPSGYKEFKAITIIDQPLSTLLAVMKDYEAHPQWMRSIKECKKVELIGNKTRYLYYVVELPWPLSNRDLVSKSTFLKQKDGSVILKIEAQPNKKPLVKSRVRIKQAEGYWKMIPLKNNQTKVIYQYASDPEGLPSWMTNMFLLEAPLDTLAGLRKQVKLNKYQNYDLKWLSEN